MNDDDKKLNTSDEAVEDVQAEALANTEEAEVEETDVMDVNPVDISDEADIEVEDSSPEETEPRPEGEDDEQLAEETEAELEDSDSDKPSEADQAAEEKVQDDVDAENAATAVDVESDGDSDPAGMTDAVDEYPNAKWYVVHTYSGHENRVATNLRQRIESEHLEHKIVDILVPTQDKIEIRGGKKEQVKEKVFPGYILVKMDLDNIAWIAVRTTQGVIGFVGAGTKPVPISDAEVKSIVQFMSQGAAPTFKEVFLVDDTVKIIDGPFADFIGKVESVDKEKGKLRVLVSIFGRETPVELDFLQVSKL